MLKKLVSKREELFKQVFPEHAVSKKTGSLYARVGLVDRPKEVFMSGRAITKGNLKQLGTKKNWIEKTARYTFLLTPKGRLMVSEGGNFSSVTLSYLKKRYHCDIDVTNIFFIGKKYEWLKDYQNLWSFKFFQGFNSLSEAKKFLGFDFISDVDFSKMFGDSHYDYLSPIILAKDKKNAVRLLKNMDGSDWDMLNDYLTMCRDNGFDIEIPAGVNRLQELHDGIVLKINEKNAENYSKEKKYDIIEMFTEVWKERGLNFKRIETPYEMYVKGLEQSHCIGTNYATTLHSYAFYTFNYEGKSYEIQIYSDGRIGQFYGRRNCHPPTELREKVKIQEGLKYNIVDLFPNGLKDYPVKENGKTISTNLDIF